MFAVCCCVVDFPRDRVPVVLAPLLYPETLDLPLSKLGIDSTAISFNVCIVGYLFIKFWMTLEANSIRYNNGGGFILLFSCMRYQVCQ